MMKYDRLTVKTPDCFAYDLKDFKHKPREFNDYDAFYAYSMAVKRLGELEERIEYGTLLDLPCRLGDEVYYVVTSFRKSGDPNSVYRYTLQGKASWKNIEHIIREWGKTVFPTRDDAKERIAELEG